MNWDEFTAWLEEKVPGLDLTYSDLLLSIIGILSTYFIAKFFIWLINKKILGRFFRKKNTDLGRQFALRQVVRYIIWALAVFSILEILGISNMILASSAALLVGIGLGLQDTFKDLISGFVILTEGTVEVGDILEVGGTIGVVTNIGLRVSKVDTRDKINIIIPNSKLVVDKVTNWSHDRTPTRFGIKVGVAYGSDLQKTKELLLRAAEENESVLSEPPPRIQFRDFGNSSLDLELFFFSNKFFGIEYIKSDLRFAIESLFKENGIQIPFPQRDLWIRNAEELK